MASKKVDGVVEAVRYAPDGKVDLVRAYQRRGQVFSDRVLLNREQLITALRAKKRYVAGTRVALLGLTFETGAEIRLVRKTAGEFVQTETAEGEGDNLKGIPQI